MNHTAALALRRNTGRRCAQHAQAVQCLTPSDQSQECARAPHHACCAVCGCGTWFRCCIHIHIHIHTQGREQPLCGAVPNSNRRNGAKPYVVSLRMTPLASTVRRRLATRGRTWREGMPTVSTSVVSLPQRVVKAKLQQAHHTAMFLGIVMALSASRMPCTSEITVLGSCWALMPLLS